MKEKVIPASLILGGLIVVSALINNDVIKLKNEHVIETTQGKVKLGEVYSENRLLTITIANESGEKIKVMENLNPENYPEKVADYVDAGVKYFNEGKEKKEQLTRQTAAAGADQTITIESGVRYYSEHQPNYILTLESKTVPLKKGELIYKKLMDETDGFLKTQKNNYESSSYID
ncbi:TPA: hypothetical protein QCH65_000413 [Enterobacter roggenkampii]|nr:hypothetical protein [Enterobacter roggenkampii]